jgi:aminocarboxymuconate-semialdehyde decarboxylase
VPHSDAVIDVHSAFVPQAYVDLMAHDGERFGMRLVERDGSRFLLSEREVPIYGKGTPIPVSTRHSDPEMRFLDMARMGVDVQVLTPPTNVFHYWQPPPLGLEVSRVINDATAALVRRWPDRFIGVGIVPLQDVALAIDELARARTLGLRAVEIGSSVNGEELDSPRLRPFFEAAASLGLPVFIHGSEVPEPRRFSGHSLVTLMGIPMATTIAAARLIFAGVLEQIPGLVLWLSHAGGVLPYLRGRMDHGFDAKAACRADLKTRPGEWIDRVYYDTIAFHPATLRFLIDMVGADRVMMGSDYPFDDGDDDPVGSVGRVDGLSAPERSAILGGTASRLLG